MWLLSLLLASLISAYASNIEAELPNQQLPETCTYTERNISDKVTLSDKNKDYPCNIRRIRYSELQTVFPPLGLVPSLYPKPFIITTDLRYNAEFAERTTICEISRQFPHNFNVTLSSSNSYSSHRRVIPLTQYLQESLDYDTSYLNKSNETWYLFGETFHPEWTQLLEHFQLPPCEMCTRPLSALSFGMAGLKSGVQWHFHGPGFSEVIHGSKHWLLLSSEFQKEGIPYYDDPTYTSFSWMEWIYPNLSTELQDALYQCTLYPGEMIYFPDSWHHATINTSPYNVFVSTFTTEYIA